MKCITPLVALATLVVVSGCGRNTPVAPNLDKTGAIAPVDLSELQSIEHRTSPSTLALKHSPDVVEVPAGSVNLLGAAIAQAGEGGTILLKSGMHSESGSVEIAQRVTIIGEPGAILESATDPVRVAGDPVEPALWVHGAPQVVIRGIEIRPSGAVGGCGILLQNAASASVLLNNIHHYQYPVLMQQADRGKIWSNRVACSTGWQTGDIPEALGITVINGDDVLIAKNVVTDGLFGIWPCDRGGRLTGNKTSACYIGIILCRVPSASFVLPDGGAYGSELPTTSCLVQGNESFANFTTGILAIDGANASQIAGNNSHDNGTYDVELSGDSYRFGFLTPACFDCTFAAGPYPGVRVKDCGNNNTVVGGILVDNNTDPCY